MDITVAYADGKLIGTRGDESVVLPEKMAFLIGTGPQRIEAAFQDALRGKYTLSPDDLNIIRRWLRYRTLQ